MELKLMKVMGGIFWVFLIPVLALGAFPEKEITVYNATSAGGVGDLTCRLLSEKVSTAFGHPVVVVNKPGAAHSICANLVANAKPDRYTIGALGSSALTLIPHMRKVPYDVAKDFTSIATYAGYNMGLVVKADAPWKNLGDFLNYAKKNPGKIIYGSDGFGTANHLIMEYMAVKEGGIEWKHVPIAGGPKLATALLGGHIHAWPGGGSHIQFIRDGTMRLLVSMNQKRIKYAPDVPTIYELGITDLSLGVDAILIGPRDLPDGIREKLEKAYLEAMKDPEYGKLLDKLEMLPSFFNSKETAKNLELQYKAYGELVRATGIKAEEKK